MTINDFCAACEWLTGDGTPVAEARYWGEVFGNWSIAVRRNGKLRVALWDAKERWLWFQIEQGDGQSSTEWIGREQAEQTVEGIVRFLRD